jgi:hypothetical protein
MTQDLWDEPRTLETKGRCEPNGIPKALISTYENKGDPIFWSSGNSRFGGDETQIDPSYEQHDPKPCIFFDIFLLVRAPKEWPQKIWA